MGQVFFAGDFVPSQGIAPSKLPKMASLKISRKNPFAFMMLSDKAEILPCRSR
jgi:hypothetical protein